MSVNPVWPSAKPPSCTAGSGSHLACDHPFKRDVTVVNDDVNGWDGAQLILTEHLVAVDGAIGIASNAVVVAGSGQDLELVDDLLDTFNFLNYILGIGLESGP